MMKLIIAIIQTDDAHDAISALTKEKFRVTKLSTTGGFLKSGNTTLMIGTEEDLVSKVISILNQECKQRTEKIPTLTDGMGLTGWNPSVLIDVPVGGATVFVLDVEQFHKL